MASAINKVKDALHLNKDKDHSTSTTHTTGTTHSSTHGTAHTTGTHGHSGTSEGVAGPHGSRVANAADPRVDSDRDGSRTAAGTTAGTGGYPSTNAGPHDSKIANKLDPTVDSDMDGSRNMGVTSGQRTAGYSGTTAGNHMGSSTTHGHQTGGISSSTNNGPHNSNIANTVDPRVDSDLSSTGNRHGANTHGGIMGSSGTHATPGSGTAQNTAGPHNSDMMNKLDPRVDADLDGSKTYGGNKTHQ